MRYGNHMFFMVQHRWEREIDHAWSDSALASILFDRDASGEVGDAMRALLKPTHDCWQVNGYHGFLNIEDARKIVDALRERVPKHDYRIVFRVTSMTDQEVR
jgi:hypothetical protein